jgi:Asp-tRNA(Asn)/Glu-tRNA(Gln) amidotransferase A subunit family amidase
MKLYELTLHKLKDMLARKETSSEEIYLQFLKELKMLILKLNHF